MGDSLTGTSHTKSGLTCGRQHFFRVRAYGDATSYAAQWSEWAFVWPQLQCQ